MTNWYWSVAHRRSPGLAPLKDFVDIEGRAAKKVVEVGTVAHEASSLGVAWWRTSQATDGSAKFGEADAPGGEERRCDDKQSGRAFVRYP